jgi:hypothetical protein
MWKAIVLALALPLGTEQSPQRHVRTTEPEVQALIESATGRSARFRLLVTTLNESDVIVYVETSVTRTTQLRGHLVHRIVVRGMHRYLRLRLNPNGPVEQRIGVIAHELQHVLEVAEAPQVGRSETIQRLFRLIGFNSGTLCGDCYETTRALDVERTVREELKATRSMNDRN